MKKFVFELVGCDESNLDAVKSAIASISGITFSVAKSARGSYVLIIECDCSEDEILSQLNAVLLPLGVCAVKKTPENEPENKVKQPKIK